MDQLSHLYMTTGKTTALIIWTSLGKVIGLVFNMLSRFVIAFLLKSKHLLILWLQSLSAKVLDPTKIKSVTVFIVSPSICHAVMRLDATMVVFWMLSFKSAFHSSLLLSSRDSSFRIWNSSAGIPSTLPALFVVMLPKVTLTSHSRISGYRWVTQLLTPPLTTLLNLIVITPLLYFIVLQFGAVSINPSLNILVYVSWWT